MASPNVQTITVETNESGDATGYSSVVRGRIVNVMYAKHGSAPYADGVDFTITTEGTAQTVWTEENVNVSRIVAPRQATHDTAGVASLYASGGEPVEDYVRICGEKLKIVIANGGDTKTGTFKLIVE